MSNQLYAFVIHKFNTDTSRSEVLHTRKFALTSNLNNKIIFQQLQDLDFSDFFVEKARVKVELYEIKIDKGESKTNTWLKFLKEYSTFKLVTRFPITIEPKKTEYKNSDGGLLRFSFRYRKIIQKEKKKKELWFSSYEKCMNDKNEGKIDILISHPYVELSKDFI